VRYYSMDTVWPLRLRGGRRADHLPCSFKRALNWWNFVQCVSLLCVWGSRRRGCPTISCCLPCFSCVIVAQQTTIGR